MNIKGIEGLSVIDIQNEVAGGARFVRFPFCISLLVVSFRLSSAVHFVRKTDGTCWKALPYMLLSLLLGWWGIPWGLLYTPACIFTNLRGGKDVTGEMMKILHKHTQGHVFDFERAGSVAQQN